MDREGLTLVITNTLLEGLGLEAGIRLGLVLALEGRAAVVSTVAVHGLLEGVVLPAEEVIAVNAVARVVAEAPVEGLGAVGGPLGLVVKLARVENDLVHDLRDLDWVRAGAGGAHLEGAVGISNVRLVVGRVCVLAIPTRGEGHRHPPAAAAGLAGEAGDVGTRAGSTAKGGLLHVGFAAEAETLRDLVFLAVGTVTHQHTETLKVIAIVSPGSASSRMQTFRLTKPLGSSL